MVELHQRRDDRLLERRPAGRVVGCGRAASGSALRGTRPRASLAGRPHSRAPLVPRHALRLLLRGVVRLRVRHSVDCGNNSGPTASGGRVAGHAGRLNAVAGYRGVFGRDGNVGPRAAGAPPDLPCSVFVVLPVSPVCVPPPGSGYGRAPAAQTSGLGAPRRRDAPRRSLRVCQPGQRLTLPAPSSPPRRPPVRRCSS